MDKKAISISYDEDAEVLIVRWGEAEAATYEPTEDERVFDVKTEAGESLGFMVMDLTTVTGDDIAIATIGDDVESEEPLRVVGVPDASIELGVSPRRVHQLLDGNRIEGAQKIGRDWVMPTPVKVKVGSRGPVGAAGPRDG